MQELRITLKVFLPIDDSDAFVMAEELTGAKGCIDAIRSNISAEFPLAVFDLTSKLVTPRQKTQGDDGPEPGATATAPTADSTTSPAALPAAQAQTAPVTPATKVTAADEDAPAPVTNMRTAPWRRAVKEA